MKPRACFKCGPPLSMTALVVLTVRLRSKVIERRAMADGVVRARFEGGWTTERLKDGSVVLELVAGAAPALTVAVAAVADGVEVARLEEEVAAAAAAAVATAAAAAAAAAAAEDETAAAAAAAAAMAVAIAAESEAAAVAATAKEAAAAEEDARREAVAEAAALEVATWAAVEQAERERVEAVAEGALSAALELEIHMDVEPAPRALGAPARHSCLGGTCGLVMSHVADVPGEPRDGRPFSNSIAATTGQPGEVTRLVDHLRGRRDLGGP